MHFSHEKLNQSVHLANETQQGIERRGSSGQEHRQSLLCSALGMGTAETSLPVTNSAAPCEPPRGPQAPQDPSERHLRGQNPPCPLPDLERKGPSGCPGCEDRALLHKDEWSSCASVPLSVIQDQHQTPPGRFFEIS